MSLSVAVISLTRDRLEFTQHCFATLKKNAGCRYDHFVLDQGSTDETPEWLADQDHLKVRLLPDNVGISRGLNLILDEMMNVMDYDVIVKFDNDCELTMPNTLREVTRLADQGGAILSPRILGLKNPPAATREATIRGETILDVPQIGGIFLAAPAWVYDKFRYSPDNPYWGMDDVQVCSWFRSQAGTCGYVKRLEAWHYLGTDGQREADEDYFARKDLEYAS